MTRKWTTIEKAIGGLEIIWGLFLLVLTIYGANNLWDFASRHTDIIPADQVAFGLTKKFHNQFILSILTIYAGTNLLLRRRIGWTTSIAASILNVIGIIISTFLVKRSQPTTIEIILIIGLISLTFLTTLILLLSKPLKDEYHTTSTWTTISLLVIILFLDSLLFKNF